MSFTLDRVVPWGRSFPEYCQMFNLTAADLQCSIVGCGDGPAGFNSELTRRGGQVVSVDPLYAFSGNEIQRRIEATFTEVLEKTRRNRHEFVWRAIASPEQLGRVRMAAMEQFLADFEAGLATGRYVVGGLPNLPFPDGRFDLALCSHFLFLYAEQFDREFHLAAIYEMLRVAPEVRIFPLLELGTRPSRHLEPVLTALAATNLRVDVEPVSYEFQQGGNQMLRIRRNSC